MVCITHFAVGLFLLVSSPFGVSSGFSLASRDLKVSPQLLSPSLIMTISTTDQPTKENGSAKIQRNVLHTADHQSSAVATNAHHVPLDTASENINSNKKTVSVVKREVSPPTDGDEGKFNGLYDPGLVRIFYVLSRHALGQAKKKIRIHNFMILWEECYGEIFKGFIRPIIYILFSSIADFILFC